MTCVQRQKWRFATPIVFFVLGFCLLVPQGIGAAESDDMLGNAEGFFKTMKQHRYQEIWPLLTRQSQEVIVKECYGRIADSGADVHTTLDQVKEDFAAGGPLAKAYWNGFLVTFDPAYVLDQSKWQIGKVGKERASITILYKKSKTPAQLLMVKEEGAWKVGLVETFWTKK